MRKIILNEKGDLNLFNTGGLFLLTILTLALITSRNFDLYTIVSFIVNHVFTKIAIYYCIFVIVIMVTHWRVLKAGKELIDFMLLIKELE